MKWETVIGLEVHAELLTESKLFCRCKSMFGGEPNTRCCPVCMGLPGALPVLNEKAVEYAVKAGLALGCEVQEYSAFDRKNYFYPDLPKGYQITQRFNPICKNGGLETEWEGGKKTVRISDIHIEEDAGKMIHCGDRSKIDFNRCGVPLIEIVTEPDVSSPEEAAAFLNGLREILAALNISDCKMEEGSMRADVNVSVNRPGDAPGTRTEIKNMSSIKEISRAIEAEAARQTAILEAGGEIRQGTLRWDEGTGTISLMRQKDETVDYRYFPEADVLPVILSREYMEKIKRDLPELPGVRRERYVSQYNISPYEAAQLAGRSALWTLFESAVALGAGPKDAAGWLMGDTMRILRAKGIPAENCPVKAELLADVIKSVAGGTLTRVAAAEAYEELFEENGSLHDYIEARGIGRISDHAVIQKAVEDTIEENPRAAADIRGGKDKAMGFLMGQAMRRLQGRGDPETVKKLLMDYIKAD